MQFDSHKHGRGMAKQSCLQQSSFFRMLISRRQFDFQLLQFHLRQSQTAFLIGRNSNQSIQRFKSVIQQNQPIINHRLTRSNQVD